MKDENIVTQFDYFILGVLAAVLFSTKYTSFFLISCIAFVVKPKYWIIIFTGFILTISILFIPIYSNVIESFKWLIYM